MASLSDLNRPTLGRLQRCRSRAIVLEGRAAIQRVGQMCRFALSDASSIMRQMQTVMIK
jgi:hypothetical protein